MTAEPLITHRVQGEGETLLLLNGGMMTIPSWEPLVAHFAGDFRLLRCDFRGQLLSPGPAHGDLAKDVEDVAALLEAVAPDPVHMIGASYGGMVSLLFAATHPEKVRSLIAVTTQGLADDRFDQGVERLQDACRTVLAGGDRGTLHDVMVEGIYSAAYAASHREELEMRRAQIAALPDSWYSGIVGLLDAVKGLDLTDRLGSIRCPTLVLSASEDAALPAGSGELLASAIPGACLEVVPGSGHALIVEQKDRTVEICRNFLEEVRSR